MGVSGMAVCCAHNKNNSKKKKKYSIYVIEITEIKWKFSNKRTRKFGPKTKQKRH